MTIRWLAKINQGLIAVLMLAGFTVLQPLWAGGSRAGDPALIRERPIEVSMRLAIADNVSSRVARDTQSADLYLRNLHRPSEYPARISTAAGIGLQVGAFFALAWVLGLLVLKRDWPVSVTRKAFSISYALLATWIYTNMPRPELSGNIVFSPPAPQPLDLSSEFTGLLMILVCLALLTRPFRERVSFLATCFAAVDRPGDRPHTLTWLTTSLIATTAILMLFIAVLPQQYLILLLIPTLVSTFGDGLAEPVGARWGRHPYSVPGLNGRTYTRTLEGSACVFVSGVIATLIATWAMPLNVQLWALALFPIILTLAEARSPHTWDQPFIFLAGGLIALGLAFGIA